MRLRGRLDRIKRTVNQLRPDHDVVVAAMDLFKQTGELPTDIGLAQAVTEWAENGTPPAEDDDSGSLAALITVTVVPHNYVSPAEQDVVMHGLYNDAVFGYETERSLARTMLRILARVGHDPSERLWLKFGWTPPVMRCNSVALTLAGYPQSFVHARHRRRSLWLAEKLFAFCCAHYATPAAFGEFMRAEQAFRDTGALPTQPGVLDAILWFTEFDAYFGLWRIGEQQPRLVEALQAYWAARAGERAERLAAVRDAMSAGPEAIDPAAAGSRDDLRRHLRMFIRQVIEEELP